jgi:Cof subfamily protein (haloacid dehalogenase superfamily)
MLACDLDGTVVRSDGTISPRTLAALAACEAAGVLVVFVTGRPPRWMPAVAAATGHRGVAICGNGAVVVDLATEEIIEVHPLNRPAVLRVAQTLRAALPGAAFAVETTAGYRQEPGFRTHRGWLDPSRPAALRPQIAPLEELLGDDPVVLKLLCRAESLRADAMVALARELVDGDVEPVHSDSTDCLLEMSAAGISKATTLSALAAGHGIGAEQVVAFGDMPNDVPMLHWAGTGYAMADGHPEAIAAADAVAPPCGRDGVAVVLEGLLAGVAVPAAEAPATPDGLTGTARPPSPRPAPGAV